MENGQIISFAFQGGYLGGTFGDFTNAEFGGAFAGDLGSEFGPGTNALLIASWDTTGEDFVNIFLIFDASGNLLTGPGAGFLLFPDGSSFFTEMIEGDGGPLLDFQITSGSDVEASPEPASIFLLGTGLLAMGLPYRRALN